MYICTYLSFDTGIKRSLQSINQLCLDYFLFNSNIFNVISFDIKVAVNVSGGEQTFPQIMADFSLFVH